MRQLKVAGARNAVKCQLALNPSLTTVEPCVHFKCAGVAIEMKRNQFVKYSIYFVALFGLFNICANIQHATLYIWL